MMFEILTGQQPWANDGGLVRTLMKRVHEPRPRSAPIQRVETLGWGVAPLDPG
jgi:hypothetical protein